jgi:phosphohistidine phosphatase
MKTLLVLRHAKSSWDDHDLNDHDRPLNARGKRDAPRVGKLLCEQHLKPDAVLSSTAKRARKTATKALEAAGYGVDAQLIRELYLADPATIVSVLNRQPDAFACVLIVGHNPGLENLVHLLSGHDGGLPTAALAQLELPIAHWCELSTATGATLRNLWLPKEE